jgi:hypothetical protein
MADTYTVEKLLGSREWAPADDPSKKTIYWSFQAKETDKVCSIGRKPDNPLKEGDSFEAEVKSEKNGVLNLKRVQKSGGFGGGGGKNFEADPKKLRGEAMRSAIHASTSYVTAMAGLGRVPDGFTYQQMDPMVLHFYGLIVDAMEGLPDAQRKSEAGL